MPLISGQVLNNRYRIVKLLGQGGYGAVYKAWRIDLNGPCAIKENFDNSPAAQSQFTREASILFNLHHPNLPRVSDHFSLPGQGQYLVMDYIEGEDLEEMRQKKGGALPERQVLAWVLQVLDALAYMHAQNPPVIHRDIKPANIKITPDGKAMLVDFGVAKVNDPNVRTLAGARAITPGYAPFEQYGQKQTDARSDIYALGATLYTLLTGQEPTESIDRMRGTRLSAPRALNPVITPETEKAVLRSLAIMPDQRYPCAADFKAALFPVVKPLPRLNTPWRVGLLVLFVIAAIFISGQWIGQNQSNRAATQTVLALADRPTRTQAPLPTSPPPISTPAPGSTQISSEDGMVLVYIPAGTFTMGSADSDKDSQNDEKPPHSVYLDAFWIDLTEVNNAMYARFVEGVNYKTDAEQGGWGSVWTGSGWVRVNGADWRHPRGSDSDINGLELHPVVQVSWNDAHAYCVWVGGQLPSEAQWEIAARGLDGRIYPWGNQPVAGDLLNFADHSFNVGWGADQSINDGYQFTAPVGSYPAGDSYYGLMDMAGNVWEWVTDWYNETYYANSPATNPAGPTSGETRILRGGSWYDVALFVRAADRFSENPVNRNVNFGFRCVR